MAGDEEIFVRGAVEQLAEDRSAIMREEVIDQSDFHDGALAMTL